MASWSDDILQKLEIRDSVEQQGAQYTRAIKQVLEELQKSGNSEREEASSVLLKRETEKLIERLNLAAIAQEKAELHIQELEVRNRALEKQVKVLQGKISGLNEQVAEKNKSFELLNDEHLTSQIQTNVLREKNRALQKENEALVKRWIEKVAADAERMNEVNLFLEMGGKTSGE